MADNPQAIKETVALSIVNIAMEKKWITPTTYINYLNAIAKAIQALEGNVQSKESMEIDSD